ncbi:hypothetical protein FOZ63_014115, partial [Perkinsus olseni]
DIDISVVKVAQTGDTRGVRNWTKEVSTTEFQCNNYNWLHDMFDGGLQMMAIDGIYYDVVHEKGNIQSPLAMILRDQFKGGSVTEDSCGKMVSDMRALASQQRNTSLFDHLCSSYYLLTDQLLLDPQGVDIKMLEMAYTWNGMGQVIPVCRATKGGKSLTFAYNTKTKNLETVELKCGAEKWWHDPVNRGLIKETLTGIRLILKHRRSRISDVIASSTLETNPIMTRQFCGDATVNLQRLSVLVGSDSIINCLCDTYGKCSRDTNVEEIVAGLINHWTVKGEVY